MTDLELNEAVAKKLGWKEESVPGQSAKLWCDPHPSGQRSQWSAPDYVHEIEAAWEIIEHLKTDEMGFSLEFESKLWSVGIGPVERNDAWTYEDADTAPRAICLAFLKLP